jgi:hypothetical protein
MEVYMLKVEDITEEGSPVGEGTPYLVGAYVLEYSGALYPFDTKGLRNPLDPINLVLCWPLPDEEGEEDTEFESVLETMVAVTQFRKKGFHVLTRYKSGAARTIQLLDGSDSVVILGDYAKDNNLLLPILSTQLSDEYDQTSIDLWKELGFKTPSQYYTYKVEKTYGVDGWHGTSLLEGEKNVTYYNILGGGKKVTVKKVHVDAEEQEVSDSDDRDWDYGHVEHFSYEVKVSACTDKPTLKTKPFHSTTPKYTWEDKK